MKSLSSLFCKFFTLLLLSIQALAQENVGIGTTSANPNAILHLESPIATPQGILLPRLTAAQRGSMSLGPTDEGLIVLDSTLDNLFLWNGAAWEELSEDDLGNHTATTNLNLNGFSLTNAAGITSSGAINFLGLGGSGNRMVTVDNAGLLSNAPLPTDNQTLTFAGNNLGISGGNTVSLATLRDNLGNHTATTNLNLNGFSLTNAAGITSSGAINFLGLGGSGDQMVTVDNAGLLSNAPLPTDNQTLTFAGNNLGISGGNTVSLATLRDNLGNHTATTNLNLNGFSLTNAAGINSSGAINFLGLGGSGNRMVTVDNAGVLGTQALPPSVGLITFAPGDIDLEATTPSAERAAYRNTAGIISWDFDYDLSASRRINFGVLLPSDNSGGTVRVRAFYTAYFAVFGSASVRWQLAYEVFSPGQNINSPPSNLLTSTVPLPLNPSLTATTSFSFTVPSGIQYLQLSLIRNSTNAGDTYANRMGVVGIEVEYPK